MSWTTTGKSRSARSAHTTNKSQASRLCEFVSSILDTTEQFSRPAGSAHGGRDLAEARPCMLVSGNIRFGSEDGSLISIKTIREFGMILYSRAGQRVSSDNEFPRMECMIAFSNSGKNPCGKIVQKKLTVKYQCRPFLAFSTKNDERNTYESASFVQRWALWARVESVEIGQQWYVLRSSSLLCAAKFGLQIYWIEYIDSKESALNGSITLDSKESAPRQ